MKRYILIILIVLALVLPSVVPAQARFCPVTIATTAAVAGAVAASGAAAAASNAAKAQKMKQLAAANMPAQAEGYLEVPVFSFRSCLKRGGFLWLKCAKAETTEEAIARRLGPHRELVKMFQADDMLLLYFKRKE